MPGLEGVPGQGTSLTRDLLGRWLFPAVLAAIGSQVTFLQGAGEALESWMAYDQALDSLHKVD